MKKLILSLIGIFLFVASYTQEKNTNTAINEIYSIQRIMVEASEVVIEAENIIDQEIVHLQFDLILENDWKWTYRILHEGWSYFIYAAGERIMVKDLDMKIMVQDSESGEWYEVDKDEKTDFSAALYITPDKSKRYAFGIKIAQYKEGFSGTHYYIMIMHPKPIDE